MGVVDIPVRVLPEILAQKVRPKEIHQCFFGDRRIDKCRAQLEAFHVGYQVAFRYPGGFRGGFLFDLPECDWAARIEYKFEQFVAVVAKPPPVGFTIMDNVARHATCAKMVAQVLGGFQLELDDVRVVQCTISFNG